VSWFWLVGAVTLSLLPPLVKVVLGGDETVVTAYLAIFAIAVGLGSRLASWLAQGRIVLFPTVIGAALLGLFALDLGWAALAAPPAATPAPLLIVLSAGLGWRIAVDLAPCRRGRPVHCSLLRRRASLDRRGQACLGGGGRQRAQCSLHGRRRADCCRRLALVPQAYFS